MTHLFGECSGNRGETGGMDSNLSSAYRYLGVKNYGCDWMNKENISSFQYRFEKHGEERVFSIESGPKDAHGRFLYPVQNILKVGYRYDLLIKNGVIWSAREIRDDAPSYKPPICGTPGERTIGNFLRTAFEPVGTTLYIFGGGWDWQDEGSGIQARTIGVSLDWVRFFNAQDENFTYRDKDGDAANKNPEKSFYPYGKYNAYYYAGLDCCGYVGWTLYNTLHSESGKRGYVGVGAEGFAKHLCELGFGEWTQNIFEPCESGKVDLRPGDVVSIRGHVWISLGTCKDGSVLILHSTPSSSRTGQPGGGPQISAIGENEQCDAFRLADKYMSVLYPEWYRRYGTCLKDPDIYFNFEGDKAGRFRWDVSGKKGGFTDPDGFQRCTGDKVIADIGGCERTL